MRRLSIALAATLLSATLATAAGAERPPGLKEARKSPRRRSATNA